MASSVYFFIYSKGMMNDIMTFLERALHTEINAVRMRLPYLVKNSSL
jgi:hypothetical protein